MRYAFSMFSYSVMELRQEGSAIPTLLAMKKRDEIKEARSTAAEIDELCRDVLYHQKDLDSSLPQISDAYGRLKKIFEGETN